MRFILFYIFIVISFKGITNDTIYFSEQENISIVNKISELNDSSDKITIDDLLSNKGKYLFKTYEKNEIHIPFNSQSKWYKFTIKNISGNFQQLNIELENSTIYLVQFFTLKKGICDTSVKMGIKFPFDKRPIHFNTFIHKISIASETSIDCYFKINSNKDALNIPVKLYTNHYLNKKAINQSTMIGVIMGFICALIMIALYSLYVSNKEYTYAYFALYTIFGGLWVLNTDGFTYQYFWNNSPNIYKYAIMIVPLLSIYLFSQFGIRFLNIKRTNAFFYKFISWYNWVILGTILIIPTNILPQAFITQLMLIEIVSVTSLNLLIAIYSIRVNKDVTIYYLVANIILIVGILIVWFNIVFGFSSVEMRSSIMKIGILFQMTVLLFALTNKIRNIQKNAEIQLKDSKQKYFDILENAIEAIFIIQNQHIKFSNSQLSILSKYRVDELIDFDVLNIVHEEDKAKIETLLNLQSKRNSSGKKIIFRSIDKEGFENWMELISVPITWEQKPASLNFMNDISQRILSEKEKELLEKQLLHAQKMETIGTLAGGIAHDFNNILTPIIGYSEMLLESVKDEEEKDDILNIKTSAYRAKELVSQILRFSHQIDSTREHVNVNNIVDEVTKLLEAIIPSSIIFKTIPYSGNLFVEINPTQLHQVLMNICTNAYQSITSSKGKITITVSLQEQINDPLLSKAGTSYVKISIEDNGTGITPEIKSKIFDPFFTTKKIGEGTGLGLSVVYGIVKNNGGNIICESAIGVGTRFDILLPICNEDKIDKKQTIKPHKGNHEQILIVDDEEKITTMLKKFIENEGYDVTIETNSIKALENIRQNPNRYRILISDITMPEITGIELAKLSLELNTKMNVIFVTGHVSQSDLETIKEIPNSEIILKPIDFSLLHKTINEQLLN